MISQHMHRLIALFFLLFVVWGCSESPLTLQVSYDEVSGLKQNDLVYFGNNEIGRVTMVSYTKDGDYLVEVQIAPPFKNSATQDSKFYIARSPANASDMAVIVEQEHSGGVVLHNGTVVQGSAKTDRLMEVFDDLQKKLAAAQNELNITLHEFATSLGATSEEINRQLAITVEELTLQFKTFTDELGKVPDSQQVKRLEESVKQFVDEFQKVGKDVQQRLQNEVVPQLRKELEELHEKLQKHGREEELKQIDKEVKKLYI